MLPERLEEQAALLEAKPSLGLVHTDLMTFDEAGVIHRTRRAFSDPCGGAILDRLLLDNFITTSTVMAPTERLQAAASSTSAGAFRRTSNSGCEWRPGGRWASSTGRLCDTGVDLAASRATSMSPASPPWKSSRAFGRSTRTIARLT